MVKFGGEEVGKPMLDVRFYHSEECWWWAMATKYIDRSRWDEFYQERWRHVHDTCMEFHKFVSLVPEE